MHHFQPSRAALDAAFEQFLAPIGDEISRRQVELFEARNIILRRAVSDDWLRWAINTLLTHGDHIDAMRAEMLRAALNRRARAGAAPSHHSEQCSPGTHYDEPRHGA